MTSSADFAAAVPTADALIVSAAVSVGPYDVVKTAIETIGRIDLVAGRRPTRQALRIRCRRPARWGSPVSSSACPATPCPRPSRSSCSSGRPYARSPAATTCCAPSIARSSASLSARATAGGPSSRPGRSRRTGAPLRDAGVECRSTSGRAGSHVISALAAADALAVIPEADDSLPAGAEVALWWLDRA